MKACGLRGLARSSDPMTPSPPPQRTQFQRRWPRQTLSWTASLTAPRRANDDVGDAAPAHQLIQRLQFLADDAGQRRLVLLDFRLQHFLHLELLIGRPVIAAGEPVGQVANLTEQPRAEADAVLPAARRPQLDEVLLQLDEFLFE